MSVLFTMYSFLCLVLVVLTMTSCEENPDDGEHPVDPMNRFKSVPTTVKTFENDTVLLPCYLDNAGSSYHVRWYKDSKLIADSSDHDFLPPLRFMMYMNHSLQVSALEPSDTAEYVCEVIRPDPWSPIRQAHAIEVLHHPEVSPIPEIGLVHVRLGEEVNIACRAKGTPQPVVTWMFNDVPMELVVNRDKLRFNVTSRHLSGIYQCVATNGVGEPARSQIKLVVDHAPVVISESTWVHTAFGVDSTLSCQVISSPPAKVLWFHGHNPVHLSTRIVAHNRHDKHTLRINRVRDKDLGTYTCKAENRLGMAEIKIQLSGVANVAVFKTDKSVATQTTYTFIWEVDSYTPIIEYTLWIRKYKPKPTPIDGVALIKDDGNIWIKITVPGESNEGAVHTTSYVLKGLTPSTAYEAQVTSRNKFGTSKPSSIYKFFTADRVDSKSTHSGWIISPTVEMEPISEDILASNQTILFATTGLLDAVKMISSASTPQSNAATTLFSTQAFTYLVILHCILIIINKQIN